MSSESSDSWGGGRGGLKILTFASFKTVFSRSSCARSAMPSLKKSRLARPAARGLWTEGGEGGGWREGLGDWLAVGSRFASTDCSWIYRIYRGEVGLEVGEAGASANFPLTK